MGIVRPPWISKEWFARYTFNYCDHFGDKKVLSKICKICAGDEKLTGKNEKAEKDLKEKNAIEFEIDLNNLPEIMNETPNPENCPIYNTVQKYGACVRKITNILLKINQNHRIKLLVMIEDVLEHSQLYVIVKIGRALSSLYEEEKNPLVRETEDAKTSAFLAYLAIKRNAIALLTLSSFLKKAGIKDIEFRTLFLEFADVSQDLAELIRQYFFPNYEMDYQEYGYEEYDAIFSAFNSDIKSVN